MKTGNEKKNYSTSEILAVLKKHSQHESSQQIASILNKGEAVRFSPLNSNNAKSDLLSIKRLLKKINDGWF